MANNKISVVADALTLLTVPPAATDEFMVLDKSDTTVGSGGTLKAVAASTMGLDVKRYVAVVTQTGTNAPTATVLENSLGGTVVYGYTSTGIYTLTLASAFTQNKTIILSPGIAPGYWTELVDDAASITGKVQLAWTSANVLTLKTRDGTSTLANDILSVVTIKVEVYP